MPKADERSTAKNYLKSETFSVSHPKRRKREEEKEDEMGWDTDEIGIRIGDETLDEIVHEDETGMR